MGLQRYCILVFCFTEILTYNIIDYGENETQPFIEIGSKYYLINTTATMNWFDATFYCHIFDSDLAVIESEAEMNALNFYLTTNEGHVSKKFWLGVTDLAEEGKFMSFKDGRPIPYAKWPGGQPNDYGKSEDCVLLWAINNIFHMNDHECTKKAYAICEMR